jgi:hypothetical protein
MKAMLHIRHQFLSFCTFFFQFGYTLVDVHSILVNVYELYENWHSEKNTFLRVIKGVLLSALYAYCSVHVKFGIRGLHVLVHKTVGHFESK